MGCKYVRGYLMNKQLKYFLISLVAILGTLLLIPILFLTAFWYGSQPQPYPLTKAQQTYIVMGIARTYNVSSVQFLSSTSTPTRGGVQVAV